MRSRFRPHNPAEPHEYIPQTRDNHFDYQARLLSRTVERLDEVN